MITITRTDRAYCSKWTQAHRKGKPTAEITREWLEAIRGPAKRPPPSSCFVTAYCESSPSELWPPAGHRIRMRALDEYFDAFEEAY